MPGETKKSASSAVTLTGRCGIDCAPSIRTGTPQECASAITCSTGLIVPSEFERCAKATNFVRGPNISANFSASVRRDRSSAPHGSPRPRLLSEQLPGHDIRMVLHFGKDNRHLPRRSSGHSFGRRDSPPSVVPRRKTISFASAAPRNCRTFSRPASKQLGRARRKGMRGAMNVRIVAAVKRRSRFNDAPGLLRGCRVVEPDERSTVHFWWSAGKSPHSFHVESAKCRRAGSAADLAFRPTQEIKARLRTQLRNPQTGIEEIFGLPGRIAG